MMKRTLLLAVVLLLCFTGLPFSPALAIPSREAFQVGADRVPLDGACGGNENNPSVEPRCDKDLLCVFKKCHAISTENCVTEKPNGRGNCSIGICVDGRCTASPTNDSLSSTDFYMLVIPIIVAILLAIGLALFCICYGWVKCLNMLSVNTGGTPGKQDLGKHDRAFA